MSIPSLKRADNGYWYAFWTDGRRSKRKGMGTKDQNEAKARFAQWLLIDGQDQGATKIDYTVADLWTIYERERAPQLASPTAGFSWRLLGPYFGALTPDMVPSKVPGYIEQRRRKVRASTVRRELVQLRAILNWAADARGRGSALISPVPAFAMPKESPPRDRWLTDVEIDRLYAASDDERITLFMRLALETAGRKQALLDLTWDRVDFETKVIHLHDPMRVATKKRRASVPISPALLPHLEAVRKASGPVLGQGDVYQQIRRIARLASVPNVSPNVFRHTAATKMARRGVPLWIIAKVLGNSLEMVERVYAKHAPDDLRAAVDLISGGK